jgi:hypothetical protein
VYQGKKDLINKVFAGKTKVIWGFTASTGRKYNRSIFASNAWLPSPPPKKPEPRDAPTGAQAAMMSKSAMKRGVSQQ